MLKAIMGRRKKKLSYNWDPRYVDIKTPLSFVIVGVAIISVILTIFFVKMLPDQQNAQATTVTLKAKERPGNEETINPVQQETDGIVLHGSRDRKEIALTFDAEMTDYMRDNYLSGKVKSSYDPAILDTLEKTNTKATFFLTGMWISLYPTETKAFGQNPLIELASHSYADTSYDGQCWGLKLISDDQDMEEIETTQKLLRDVAGVDNKYFRFPGGCYSQKDLNIVQHIAGLTVVHWDVVGNDGFNDNADSIVHNVVDNVQNGSIIVLHMNGAPTAPKTTDALPTIIAELKAKGYEFVKVSELLQQ